MASATNCPDKAEGRIRGEDYRMEPSSPNEQSTSSAPDIGSTTTTLHVPPSETTDAQPTSTERQAPDSPATAFPPYNQLDTSMVRLGDLAVETVFPTAGFYRLRDGWVRCNEETMRRMQDGVIPWEGYQGWPIKMPNSWFFKEKRRWRQGIIAGSRAEGVAVEPGWGHPPADADIMWLHGGDLAVGVDCPGQLQPWGVSLMYRGEGCPPAYTRLEVVRNDRLVAAINRERRNGEVPAHTCVREEGCLQWLLSRRLLDAFRDPEDRTIQGPSAATPGSHEELVMAMLGTGPHPDMAAYSERPRTSWPSLTQLHYLLTLGMLIVCVGPKGHPDTGRLFRVSTSPHEMSLITDLVLWMKQGYICFKYVLKSLLASSRQGDDDGRSRVGSYHLKNVFLWYLEEHPPQPEGSPYNLTLNLCQKLQQCLLNRIIHNYFMPECNLLEKVKERELQQALRAVAKVLHDPLAVIIGSPFEPEQIFGSRHSSDDLLRCFRAVSDQPACESARESLQQLLWDLDEHRVRRYAEQLEEDNMADEDEDEYVFRVSGRPGLVRLAD